MWLYLPTSACTPVAGDSILDSDWRIQMLSQSFTWRGTWKQARYWLTILKRDSWMMPLFGLIPEPSTANHLLTKWIGSLPDSPASRGVERDKERDSMTSDGSGPILSDWFAKYDPEDCSWRTSQVSFLVDLNTYSETWPRSGSMRNGQVYERPMSVRPIVENESLSWDTKEPRWATPTTRDYKDGDGTANVKTNSLLGRQAPRTLMPGQELSNNDQTSPQQWRTPEGSDGEGGTMQIIAGKAGHYKLGDQVGDRKILNPKFVEWLMGWPEDWIEFHVLESLGTE